MIALDREQVRNVDRLAVRQFGFPGIILMENAARGAAEILARYHSAGRVTVCCGKGNNGGDGYAMARHLAIAGIDVAILALAPQDSLAGDAATQSEIAGRIGLPIRELPSEANEETVTEALLGSDWIVDALLGTGASGPPRRPFDAAIRAMNTAGNSGARILAVDLPSGLDADRGIPFRDADDRPAPCVRADLTATFVARKIGFDWPQSREYTGEVVVLGIGIPSVVVDRATGGD